MKAVITAFWALVLIPVLVLIVILTGVARLCTMLGFGFGALTFLTKLTQTVAPLRIREVQPYKFPVPNRFVNGGHIRFTGIRTANAKGVPLKEEDQVPMLYMARINFTHRLLDSEQEAIRQLALELAKRRIKAKEAYVYPEGEVQRFKNKIIILENP